MHFHSYEHGLTAYIGRGKIACKNTVFSRRNEASYINKTQTGKFPSTTLKMDQKYEHLQYMAASKSVYKYVKNMMKNKAQKVP